MPGPSRSWVGDYPAPARGVSFTAHGHATAPHSARRRRLILPAESLDHPQLPRLWAQASVNALLDQIAREGESRAAIDEIIQLSRRYKFVTPYTSFLAAPRSLLRPRVIRPGDPVLRVHTDPSIESVIALFPFGLTKPLRHIAGGRQERSGWRSTVGDALSRANRYEGWDVQRPAHSARRGRPYLSRGKELRDRLDSAGRENPAGPDQVSPRRLSAGEGRGDGRRHAH